MSRRLVQLLAILALFTGAVLALGACGGEDESPQEQAMAQVCDARNDINQQVDRLANLTVTTATVDEVRSGLQAIDNDLNTIADQQSELSAERRQQVEEATRTFSSEVANIVGEVGSSLSLSGAQRQLNAALTQLQDAYRTSLARVDCG